MTEHINCGGELTIIREDSFWTYCTCTKCHRAVKIFTAPSYNEYVAEGYIKKVTHE